MKLTSISAMLVIVFYRQSPLMRLKLRSLLVLRIRYIKVTTICYCAPNTSGDLLGQAEYVSEVLVASARSVHQEQSRRARMVVASHSAECSELYPFSHVLVLSPLHFVCFR